MNDLLPTSFTRVASDHDSSSGAVNLDNFFADVESVKNELKELETIHRRLLHSHDISKTLHTSKSIKNLHSEMDADVTLALKKAKLIKSRLEALDRSNAAHRSFPNSGPGSSSDRARTSVVNALRKKLYDAMTAFTELRNKISYEHRDAVQRRFYTVTGENPDAATLEALIETGQSETFLQKAIQEQGRGRVMDTVFEIQERHEGVKEMEKSLQELHQVFLDMAVLVQAQGEQLDDIESQVLRANSIVRGGTQELQTARKLQKNTRKWICYGIIILLVVVLIVILSVLRPWENKGGQGGGGSTPAGTPMVPTMPPPSPSTPPRTAG